MRFFIFTILTVFTFSSCQSQSNHDCPFPYQNHKPEDQCGFVEVSRNWDTNSSETTKLGYLVIKSKSSNRKDDPVIFLQGGPGGSVLSLANVYSQINIDRDRDFILYDQRGIGFSEELCPDLNLQLLEVMALDLEIDKEIGELQKRINSCANYLKTDDRQFSTVTNVKDLEALRKHLGYNQLNLFGGSYGTRLGIKYMELYPNSVRSSVLSGLFPPEIRMYDDLFSSFNSALELVFKTCKNDTSCNTKYPDLKSDFILAYNAIKENPITITADGKPIILNQQDALIFLHQMLYNAITIGNIPSFIEALKTRDNRSISRTVTRFLPRLTLINLGVYYSIMTADEGRYDNASKLNEDSEGLLFADSGLSMFSADPEVIKSWPTKTVKSNEMNTLSSDIPTLLISGDFDPVTPPKNGNVVAKSLSNDQHFTFKNNGHVPINGCFFNLAKQFLDHPDEKLKTECHNTETKIRWN